MRNPSRAGAPRKTRIIVPDPRRRAVRKRVALAVARLDPAQEADALAWIERVALFDEVESSFEQ